jgi:glutamate decarboxylase
LNFSRPGGEIICQYYNFLRLGKEGYRAIQNECFQLGRYLAEKIAGFGPFRIIYDGEGGIPGLCWELKDPAGSSFTLYQYADRLRERGWLVPAYSMPPNREDLVIQRILVRHGFTRAMADELLQEMKSALDEVIQQPPELAVAGVEGHDHSGR